jgi:hypothetical protein
MGIGAADVTRVLRRVLYPALKDIGFTKIKGRCAWRNHGDCVWVLQIRTVGKRFASITGYPHVSLCGELCIFYPDFPAPDPTRPEYRPPRGKDQLYEPKPPDCPIRYSLQVSLDQAAERAIIKSQTERNRDDVWYVQPDGSAMCRPSVAG